MYGSVLFALVYGQDAIRWSLTVRGGMGEKRSVVAWVLQHPTRNIGNQTARKDWTVAVDKVESSPFGVVEDKQWRGLMTDSRLATCGGVMQCVTLLWNGLLVLQGRLAVWQTNAELWGAYDGLDMAWSKDLNCGWGRIFRCVVFIVVVDITYAIVVIAGIAVWLRFTPLPLYSSRYFATRPLFKSLAWAVGAQQVNHKMDSNWFLQTL